MVFRIFAELTRAREIIRGPVFSHFPEKCERFLNFCNFAFKKFEVQSLDFLCNNFLCLVWGLPGTTSAPQPQEQENGHADANRTPRANRARRAPLQ